MTENEAASIVGRLRVEPAGNDVFGGSFTDDNGEGRAFGGEIIGQAAMAASLTVAGRALHSMHAYFLRPGRCGQAVEYHVERVRDGRTFSNRRVAVVQAHRVICEATASFTAAAEGEGYQDQTPDVPSPDELPDERSLAPDENWEQEWPVEFRHVDRPWVRPVAGERPIWRTWARLRAPLPDDALLHAAALVYVSDFGSLGAIERRLGERFVWGKSASLDHALWLRTPARWDDWLLVTTESEFAAGGRAISHRNVYTADGARVAHVAQEALFGTT